MADSLSHHGIKGMHWGVRRFQNPDGTLTAAGRARYGAAEDAAAYKYNRPGESGWVGAARAIKAKAGGGDLTRAARKHARAAERYQRTYGQESAKSKARNAKDKASDEEWKEIEKHNPKYAGEYERQRARSEEAARQREEADNEWKELSDLERRRADRTQEYHDNAKRYWDNMSTGRKVGAVLLYGACGAQHYSALRGNGADTTSAVAVSFVSSALGGPIGHAIVNNISRNDYANRDDD